MTIPKIATYEFPTNLPSNRVDWQPDPARAVLLIHDLQDYFLDFYDVKAAPIPAMLAHAQTLRATCDSLGIPVVYTAQPAEQTAQERGLLQDWWGAGLTAKPERVAVTATLTPREHDVVLRKWRYSAFQRTDLLQRMQAQGRDQLLICGVYAHIGCMTSALEAFMHDIQPFFIADAVADFSAAEHQMAINYVAQRCGVVISTAQACQALQTQAAACATPLPRSQQELTQQVAAILQMPASDLQGNDNLLFLGLDSIRMMSLMEGWRAAGAQLDFVALAEKPTLADWWALLSGEM